MTKNEEESGGEQIGVDVGCESGPTGGAARDESALVCRIDIDEKTFPSFTDDHMIDDSGTSCHCHTIFQIDIQTSDLAINDRFEYQGYGGTSGYQ